jgi:hypothetical protein
VEDRVSRAPQWQPIAVLCATFLLHQGAQVAMTPVAEGMDVFGHLSYLAFVQREGRAPRAGELSVPADIRAWREACLGPDYVCPGAYRRWRQMDDAARQTVREAALRPAREAPYVEPNYQVQHPPLYYRLLLPLHRLVSDQPFDEQVLWLSLASVAVAAVAIPAVYLTFASVLSASAAFLLTAIAVWFPNLMPFLGRVTNDTLAFPVAAWLIFVIARRGPARRHVAMAALLLGLGLYVKTYFLALAPAVLAWAAFPPGGAGRRRFAIDWRSAACAGGVFAAVAGPLFAWNLATSGHLVPLQEARLTAGLGMGEKLAGLFHVEPYWFLAGMARNFVWVGYWSFVSPSYLFYAPAVLPVAALLLARPWRRRRAPATPLWPQALLLAFFIAGMWWHAALFRLDALARGLDAYSGNEGYYANVILPAVVLLLAVPMHAAWGTRRFVGVAALALAGMVAWNLAARLAMIVFWGGGVELVGRERLMVRSQFLAELRDLSSWAAWRSQPGVVEHLWLPAACLAAAILLTTIHAWRVSTTLPVEADTGATS